MSSISPLTNTNILPPTIPYIGPSLSSESEDEGEEKTVEEVGNEVIPEIVSEVSTIPQTNMLGTKQN